MEYASHQKTNAVWFHLHEVWKIFRVKFLKTESIMVVTRDWGEEEKGMYGVLDVQDEKVLFHNEVNILNTTEMAKIVVFKNI